MPTTRARQDYARRVADVSRICRRLRDGESLSEICRDPMLPQRATLDRWCEAEPHFAAREAREAAGQSGTWKRRANHRFSEDVIEELLERIAEGRGLAEVCEEPDMPNHVTVSRWLGSRPEFQERYKLARHAQADRLFDLAWRIAREATPETLGACRLMIDTLKWRVAKLAPRVYGTHKAQSAEQTEPQAPPERLVFVPRRFALTADKEVVEITQAVRGLDAAGIEAVKLAVKEGRWPPVEVGGQVVGP